MRILIVTAVFPPEPVVSAKISQGLAIALSQKGHTVTVFAPPPSRPVGFDFANFRNSKFEKYYEAEVPSVEVIHANSIVSPKSVLIGRLRENYSFGKKASAHIAKNPSRYDCIYINSWPLISQYLIAKAAVKINAPYFVHIQDIYPESLSNKFPSILRGLINNLLMPLELYQLKNARKIIAISTSMQQYLCSSRDLPKEKVAVVYNWQDETDFLKLPENNNDKFTFMYLGNIGPVAGVEILVEAFGKSNAKNACLVIAGNGSNKDKCLRLAALYPLSDIRFIAVPEGGVARAQQQANVLVLPMKQGAAKTSIPSKLPAYMFSAKPVLASIDRDSDTGNTIISADCGWIVPCEDVEQLKVSFEKISSMDRKILQSKGKSGRDYALNNFSKEKNLQALVEIITQ
jgi:glycosyltransferase involved in cell wall biosynthesis